MTEIKGVGKSTPIPDSFYESALAQSGIYALTCNASGRAYIGSAINIGKRWRKHWTTLEAGKHHNHHLQNAWRKYGPTCFTFSVLEIVGREDLLITAEQRYLGLYAQETLYNLSPTAGSLRGFKQSPEAVEKMRRNCFLGRRHTEETKRRLSDRFRGRNRRGTGWKMSDEQKAKLHATRQGKPLSQEHRNRSVELLEKAREKRKGIPWTVEHRTNLANSRRTLSDAQVLAAREAYNTGQSLTQLGAQLGVSRNAVQRAVRGAGIYGTVGHAIQEKIRRPAHNKNKPGKPWDSMQKAKASISHRIRYIAGLLLAS